MRKEYIYFIQDNDKIKIGRSYNPKKRLFELRLEKTKHMKILKTIECLSFEHSCLLEKEFQNKYADQKSNGEWFFINDYLLKEIES